ncbi:heavy-metal-associated domain-containing protein [Romboutsia lituseburensis]|uniref:heavy-metal-associated domain-containing protein n=1 Tax=Romboutsia lituseburensis TaxID=1537 RepID=UPI00215B0F8C|nr:heavy-metal-associated domain-containing protein [Romboutsia lituseburensis]MCR8746488.1 heavy-metal-associated domain-containing protein [Romboutsia lituseburensis]
MNKKLLIEGMSCGHCVNHLKTALIEDIEGIDVLEVNLEGKYALVEMNNDVRHDELKKVIEELGFELKGIQ